MRRRSQVMAEFAIGFPILLFLFFGAMQLIFIYLDHIVVKYAAFQAARAYVASSDFDVNDMAEYDPILDDVKGPSSNEDRAHLAAALICTPMTFRGKPDGAGALPDFFDIGGGKKIHWPGWTGAKSNLNNLEDAWFTTNVRVINDNQPGNKLAKKVEIEVDHDLKLIFPLVGGMIEGASKLFGTDYASINADLDIKYQKTYSNERYHRVTEKCVIPINNFASSEYEN
ncbi:MAG: hypothetical protein COA79_00140 [Planctomycetota bacterium]|nr:MAG: hypothetical protein COA79_00140 [Planctomycetota bacterium]